MPVRVYRSSYPEIVPLDVDLNTFLFSNPNNTPRSKPVFIDAITGEARTFDEIQRRTRSLAHGLRQLGVRPKDIVSFISPNSIDYALTCYAIIGCGATVSPINAASTPVEVQDQLETSEARLLIAHSCVWDTAEKAIRFNPTIKLIQADGQGNVHGQPTAEQLALTCPPTPLVTIEPEEAGDRLCFMCFSSGTTGRAKGVMTTHRNMVSNLQQWMVHMPDDWTGETTSIAFLPFSHIYGLSMFPCMSMLTVSSVVVLPRFDLDIYLGAVQKYKPKALTMVPPVALLLAKDPRVTQYDLRSVERILCAAAPLSVEVREAVEGKFKQAFGTTVQCFQAWGMTETSPLGTVVPLDRMDKKHTVGNVTPSMEFRVVDPETMQDAELDAQSSATQPGEIWCRGPNVMKGYYKNAAATRDSFVRDQDGHLWFRTGDIGTIDKDGFLTIVDRIKEMIKYKGLQVTPSELEGKLLKHPDVEDACVVGIWVEQRATELPVGFIVITKSAKLRGEKAVVTEVNEWLNKKVANHKRLRGGLHIVDAIPKSPSGKILRRRLKDSLKTKGPNVVAKL